MLRFMLHPLSKLLLFIQFNITFVHNHANIRINGIIIITIATNIIMQILFTLLSFLQCPCHYSKHLVAMFYCFYAHKCKFMLYYDPFHKSDTRLLYFRCSCAKPLLLFYVASFNIQIVCTLTIVIIIL